MRVKKYYPHEVPEITCLDPGFECQYVNSSGIVTHEKLRIPQWSAVNGLSDVITCLREIRLLWSAEMQPQPAFLLKSLGSSDSLLFPACCDDIEMDPREFIREDGAALSDIPASSTCDAKFNANDYKTPHHGEYSLHHAPAPGICDFRGMTFDSRLSSQPDTILVESPFFPGARIPSIASQNAVSHPWMAGIVRDNTRQNAKRDPDELSAEDGMDQSGGD
jgi:hypothetical protein